MKKLCYWLLLLVLIISIGYLHHENAATNDRLTEVAKGINVLSEQTERIHKQTDNVNDRVTVIEQDWQNVFGQIPAGSDEIATPTEPYAERYEDDDRYAGFYGRLYVPDAGIDVALYRGSGQYITDRADSANLFTWMDYTGKMIADHNNQEFAKLFSVEKGMTGYIWLKDGDIINIECDDILNGHNTVWAITDESGDCVMSSADYVMYTCRDCWQNVRICLWNRIG
jgi:hypothetical protein